MSTVAVRHHHPSDAIIIVPSVASGGTSATTKMPHTNHTTAAPSSPGDDFGSTDEVKVFKDEGDKEDEQQSEILLEEKSSLIDLTESEDKTEKPQRTDSPLYGKFDPHHPGFNVSYLVSPYSYANGAAGALPAAMANKIGLTPFFCPNGDHHLTTPPPAHCGIPPYQIDPKTMGEFLKTK
ncbi:hypothetical protein PVAND_014919 [Polypedilum vanderplanki]|uniref:Uncharacterized protein n=1 Tax=Polypedilum vanderplanki TaxID=319348 RepID=A0A9J6BBH0_POLVA|nr:hypothetical protein PVAND_014919 [Polypedilum vanderplanki]